MNFWNKIRSMCQPPSAEVMAAQEYDLARRSLLEAHSAREYAEAMVTYHQRRIDRLRKTIAGEEM